MGIFRRGRDIGVTEKALGDLQVRGPQHACRRRMARIVKAEVLHSCLRHGAPHRRLQSGLCNGIALAAHQPMVFLVRRAS